MHEEQKQYKTRKKNHILIILNIYMASFFQKSNPSHNSYDNPQLRPYIRALNACPTAYY